MCRILRALYGYWSSSRGSTVLLRDHVLEGNTGSRRDLSRVYRLCSSLPPPVSRLLQALAYNMKAFLIFFDDIHLLSNVRVCLAPD